MRSLTRDLAVPRIKYFRKPQQCRGNSRISNTYRLGGVLSAKGAEGRLSKSRRVPDFPYHNASDVPQVTLCALALSESRDSRSPHLRLCHLTDNDKVISCIIIPVRMLECLLFHSTFVEDGFVKKAYKSSAPASSSTISGPTITQCL